MRNVMPIDPKWLVEVAPHYHKTKDLETLGTDRKMPKGQGKPGTAEGAGGEGWGGGKKTREARA